MGASHPIGVWRPVPGGAALLFAAALLGCPTTALDPCNTDADCALDHRCELGLCVTAGEPDGGNDDAGVDAGSDDAGATDAGTSDAGSDDAGPTDAGSDDAGPTDAGPGDAGPPDAGGCALDQHDGGDGTCVALGQCSPGFTLYFDDSDGDGVGAGPQSSDCAALPLATGRALSDDDCAPDDPLRFTLQLGFDDYDLDSYTAGPASSCVGDVPEQGIVEEERGPPYLAYAASASSGSNPNPWNSPGSAPGCCGGTTSADIDPAADTSVLTLSDFGCLAVPPRIDLVRVRAHVRQASGVPQDLTMEVTLLEGGVAGTTRSATTRWAVGSFTDVVIEGPAADFGIGAADPAATCAGALDAELVVLANGSYGGSVELDYLVLELLGGDDCDPQDATLYSPLSLYGDGDNDTFVGGAPVASCVGDAVLGAWVALVPVDCDDTDADAHPGQTGWYTGQRNSGGWDYDCDGTEEKRAVSDAAGCVDPGDGTCAATSVTSKTGDCGAQVDADDCPAAVPCDLIQDTDPIACH